MKESLVVIVVCVPDLCKRRRLPERIGVLGDCGMFLPVGSLISRRIDNGEGFGDDMVGKEECPRFLLNVEGVPFS